jgi:hypothetical protein
MFAHGGFLVWQKCAVIRSLSKDGVEGLPAINEAEV